MLRKKSRPVIGVLAGSLIAGNGSKLTEVTNTPRPHLSPTGRKSFNFGGVGLGIVAALENSSDVANKVLLSRSLNRSKPIPVPSPKKTSSEKSDVKACVDGRRGDDRSPFRIQIIRRTSVFHIAPARSGEAVGIPTSDFLSSCHMCRKKLHGEDIYMYRGEKAFCSTGCRYRQIKMEECAEKQRSKASRHVDVSSSPCANGQIFTSEIFAI